jgi:trimeric autotransporter adhesin
MPTINDTFVNALLADASYVNDLAANMPASDLRDALTSRMTPTVAKFIADNFTVVTSINTPDNVINGAGFDGVAWRGNAGTPYAGKLFVSMRGTEGVADFVTDANLALYGDAAQQTADMVNWWLREATPAGQTVPQITWRALTGTFVSIAPAPSTGRITAADLSGEVQVNGHSLGGYLASGFTRLLGTSANVAQTSTFNSAGFAQGADATFAALQALISPQLGRPAFPAAGNPSQLNYFATHGLNLTTNTWWFNQVGKRIELFNEESATQIPNHFMYKLTDSLAFADAMSKLDPSMTLARANSLFEAGSTQVPAELEGTLDGLRRLLLGPNATFTPAADVSGSAGTRVQFHANLNALVDGSAFQSLRGRVRIDLSSRDIGAKARNDFSAMASLLTVSPVVLTGTDAAGAAALQSALQSVWGQSFTDWQADSNLTAEQRQAGLQNFSDNWIDDRSRLLNAALLQTQRNSTTGLALDATVPADRIYEFQYYGGVPRPGEAQAPLQTLIATSRPGSVLPPQFIAFGSDEANVIDGTSNQLGDHLYGGGGADTVNGLGGADWLEGNAGNDQLDGGAGNDTLRGGQGDDRYTFTAGWGFDEVIDSDGFGTITVAGIGPIDGSNTVKVGEGVWQTPDARVNYTQVAVTGGHDLYISFSDRTDVIVIQNWSSERSVGITLGSAATPPAAVVLSEGADNVHLISGAPSNDYDYIGFPVPYDARVIRGLGGNDEIRALKTEPDGVEPIDNILSGGQGNDFVFGGTGDDVIYGDEGNDFLAGNEGNNVIYGGAGNDIVVSWVYAAGVERVNAAATPLGRRAEWSEVGQFWSWGYEQGWNTPGRHFNYVTYSDGSLGPLSTYWRLTQPNPDYVMTVGNFPSNQDGKDIIFGGEGNDLIAAGADNDIVSGDAGQDAISGGSGDDILSGGDDDDEVLGGLGNDVLDGDQGADDLYGAEGADTIRGGIGNDFVFGDLPGLGTQVGSNERPFIDESLSMPDNTDYAALGNDWLDGGDGNDALVGAAGADTLFGGSGDDQLLGDHQGTPLAYQGDDLLDGGIGNDTLKGQGGNDLLYGGDGNDVLAGGEGDDLLQGGLGTDTLDGGAGSDTYVIDVQDIAPGTSEVIDDFSGANTLLINGRVTLQQADNDGTLRLLIGEPAEQRVLVVRGAFIGAVPNLVIDGEQTTVEDWVAANVTQPMTLIGDAAGVARSFFGGTGNDTLIGGASADRVTGSNGDDLLAGMGGADTLLGGAGADELQGDAQTTVVAAELHGADLLDGGEGNDTLIGGGGNDTLLGGPGANVLFGEDGDDLLIDGDILSGGMGSDTYVFTQWRPSAVVLDQGDAQSTDTVVLPPATLVSAVNFQRVINTDTNQADDLQISRSTTGELITVVGFFAQQGHESAIENFQFSDGTVLSRADVQARVDARADSEAGEIIDGYRWNDTLHGLGGSDWLRGHEGDDVLTGDAGNDRLEGGDGNDDLDGGKDTDNLLGGLGADTYRWSLASGMDTIEESASEVEEMDTLILGSDLAAANVTLYRDGVDLTVVVGNSPAQLTLKNYFVGSALFIDGTVRPIDNRVELFRFSDGTQWNRAQIDAKVLGFADSIAGTAGNDTFTVDDPRDLVVEGANQGIDTIYSSISYSLPANVENLYLTGALNANATGNALANVLAGNANNNVLRADSRARQDDGADTLQGGAGDDTYYIDNVGGGANDVIEEAASEGQDTVFVDAMFYTLPTNVENLTAVYSAFTTFETPRYNGNAMNNRIVNNTNFRTILDGGQGADTMTGGNNDDFYIVDNVGDVVIERMAGSTSSSGGFDTVSSSVSFALPVGVEVLEVAGVGGVVATGNAGNNTLDGSGTNGADTLLGGAGNDTYRIRAGIDAVVEASGAGTDTVVLVDPAQATYYVSDYENIENLTVEFSRANLVGNAGDNQLIGSGIAVTIDGGAGNDVLLDQGYRAGYPFIVASDTLLGGAGNDRLISRGGADLLDGGAGDDQLTLSSGVVRFGVGSGADTVLSGAATVVEFQNGVSAGDTTVLRSGADLLLWIGGADMLRFQEFYATTTGMDFVRRFSEVVFNDNSRLSLDDLLARLQSGNANVVTDGADLLLATPTQTSVSGAGGNDRLYGHAGNDTLFGNAGEDTLWGGNGDDVLSGNADLDVLRGGTGSDTYILSRGDGGDTIDDAEGAADSVSFGAGIVAAEVRVSRNGRTLTLGLRGAADAVNITGFFGNDDPLDASAGTGRVEQVRFADGTTWTVSDMLAREGRILGSESADVLIGEPNQSNNLSGLGGNDRLEGGALNDTLDGGAGADTMVGGDGGDTYLIDNAGDVIQESAAGTDVLSDAVESSISFALPDNVEYLTLTGDVAITATGNNADNTLSGNDLANILDGRGGADEMYGGWGDDHYIIDNVGDNAHEDPGMGVDLVESSVSYTLLDDVENLTLTGTAAINGTGNAANNSLVGNSAANTLTGNAGNDTLDGGAGSDSLVGGAGDDTYVVDSTSDVVTESANNGNDIVRSTATFTLGANVEQLVLLGNTAISGTGNSANNVLSGNGAANALNGGAGADTLTGGAGDDTYTVDNAGDMVIELAAEGTDAVSSSITYTLSTNVENLALTGATAINGTGNALENVLTGNSAANVLTGGAGNDTYVVGAGDSVVENVNEGIDVVQSAVSWTLASNVENLLLTGTTAINGTGNAATNTLTGNSGANRLDGAAGADSMIGGAGNDTYVVENAGDSITELVAGGTDAVESAVTWVLSAEIENLTLTGTAAINGTGNAVANTLIGNAGANRLDGGAGADAMTGGAGNDVYVVDNVADTSSVRFI